MSALRHGLDLGINLLDTSDAYGCGHSEKLIGEVLQGRREQVIIATKFGYVPNEGTREQGGVRTDPDYIKSACGASLRRLQTDYIDLYQFHVGNADDGEQVREVCEELVAEGKIRWYGWSTDSPERARIFAEGKHCTAIQQGFNIFGGNDETLEVCEQENLASILRGPLAKGLLTGKFSSDTTFPSDDVRHKWDMKDGPLAEQLERLEALKQILTSDGRSLAQGSLCWLWARSPAMIPIPGFKTVKQVEDNAGAMEFEPLSEQQMSDIKELLR